jgi:4-hydroxythreonine-4-phosphate dehydrogenase
MTTVLTSGVDATLPPPPLALTMGDPCGIGPEIVAAQWLAAVPPHAVVVGSCAVMARALATLARFDPRAGGIVVQPCDIRHVQPAPSTVMLVWEPEGLSGGLERLALGQVSALAGQAAAVCVRQGAYAVRRGLARALVTAPLHKAALALAGEPFPGHTELLQALATPAGQALLPVRMMLANDALRVVLVSIHVSLRQALDAVTHDQVLQTIRIAHDSLRRMGMPQPRVAVAGLNPHAGEGGIFGREEQDVIAPAVQQAQREGIDATGPWAPDTVFMRARHAADKPGEFDVVVAMYHDQGLIPVKYLGVADGVNITLGLPFVRTSPDHGTAFDLAGSGLADPSSLRAACRMALSLTAGLTQAA